MMAQVDSLKTGIKYKDTPIGKIPMDWEVGRLGELAAPIKNAFSDGPFGSNLKLEDYIDSGIPVLQGKNITKNRLEWFDIRYVTKKKAEEHSRSLATIGDILMTKIGTVGCVAIVSDLKGYDYALIPANLMKITLNRNKVDTHFLYQFLLWPLTRKRIVDISSQTAQPALSLKGMKAFEIALPPLLEQKKIAEILTTMDEAIESTVHIIEKTKEVKKGLMQKLLTRGIGHKKFKKTEIGEIPEEWEIGDISDYGEIVTGSTPPTSNRQYYGNEYPFVSPFDLGNRRVIRKTEKYLSKEGFSASRGIPINSVMVVCIGSTIGKTGIAGVELATNQQINSIVCRNSDHNFVYYYATFISSKFRQLAGTQAVPIINKGNFSTVKVAIPPLGEQERIGNILSSIDDRIEEEANHREQLEVLKKGLMQVLLTGKIRVSV